MTSNQLPELPLAEWEDTRATLHMWSQVVGKIRLAQTPLVNHWWNVPLYLSARGLTTSAMPYADRTFEIEFDFISHQLVISTSDGETAKLALKPRTVADFYRETMQLLRDLGIEVKIWTTPVEVPDPIPFEQDTTHASYDPEYAQRFWRALAWSAEVFAEFRAGFVGKCSPVHFFWGSFDLAVTRFSGRRAPAREGADIITREAYSHEVISHGFWAGSGNVPFAAFYAYAAPEPAGFQQAAIRPASAYYNKETGGYVLPYEDVRRAPSPERTLLDFAQTTYDAGATLGGWDRASLERTT
ncbi:MAG: hypothetical protein QOF61_1001 [Acidobacteriota bacterium]|jgi:hypothetical protein|nr:hypothetical protein [Acidobacteriota bacterium]